MSGTGTAAIVLAASHASAWQVRVSGDRQTNKQTNRRTEGQRYRVKPSLTHSLVDLPRWGLATADDHSDIFLLHCARSCDISFSWMYLQPVHSSMSCIHCLLGLPWCRSPSVIPSRTVSVRSYVSNKLRYNITGIALACHSNLTKEN